MARRRQAPDGSARIPRPGRPKKPAATAVGARRRLLDAAATAFATGGFAGTSLRSIADQAEVTPAMVSYYFGDKAGLLEAVLRDGFALVLDAMNRSLRASDSTRAPVQALVAGYLEALNAHPWLPRIVVQEVISRDTPLRKLFVEQFAYEALKLAVPLLRQEQRAGRLRDDLDTRLTVISVVGMCVFPYIAEPLLGQLLDYRIDDAFAGAFIPHTVELLERGLQSGS